MANAKNFPLSLIIRAVDRATSPLGEIGKKIEGLSKSATRAGKALSLGVTAPLAGIAAASVAAATKFETGMTSISTLIDTSTESIEDMGKEVLAIGRRTPVALDDLTTALYDIRGAGIAASNQFSVLEGSARLAVAGLGTTKQATDLVTSSINAFGLEGEKLEKVYDNIFKVVKYGKTSVAGIAQGFGAVAGTVAASSIELDEYLASVGALTTTGLPAAQAHSQLRAAISGLTRETKESKALFDHLGATSFKNLVELSGGMVPAFNRIKTALRGDTAAILKLVGSTEALNAVLGLTGAQAETYNIALEDMRHGADAVGEAFRKQDASTALVMQRLRNSLQSVSISLGRIMLPALQAIVPPLQAAANWWEKLGGGTQRAIVYFATAAAVLGPTLLVIGKIGPLFLKTHAAVAVAAGWGKYLWMMRASIMAGLIPSLKAATASTWAFNAALLTNPIVWLAASIGAAAFLIFRNWKQITLFFRFLWDDVTRLFQAALGWLKKALAWHPLGLIVQHWAPIKEFFTGLWEGVVGSFQWAWDNLKKILGWIGKAITSSPIFKALSGIASFVKTGLAGDAANLGAASGPSLGAERAAPPSPVGRSEANVNVTFDNMPRGARASVEPGSTADLHLDMGYSMVP